MPYSRQSREFRRIRIAVVCALTGLLGACGGGGDGAGNQPSNDTGTPTPGTNVTAASCYDANLGDSPGSTYEVVSAFSDSVTGVNGTMDFALSIGSLTTFQGYAAYEYDTNVITTTNDPANNLKNVSNQTAKYYQKRTGTTAVTNYGWTSQSNMTTTQGGSTTVIAGTATTVFTPPWVDTSYALEPGKTVTQTYTETATITSSVNGGAPTTQTGTSSVSITNKFVGIETITVPAGSFQACRFQDSDTPGNTTWTLVGTGMTIKSTTVVAGVSNYALQATSIKVNGKSL